MKDINDRNFGLIIAFWLPGFILLWGLSFSFASLEPWMIKSNSSDGATFTGFLYATVASLSLGLVISAVRWLVVDHFLGWLTTLKKIDFAKIESNKDAFAYFQGVVENHYRYYQYYSNTLVAVDLAAVVHIWHGRETLPWQAWVGLVLISLILLCASRDALRKYHDRSP
jgi:hypothetical protein